MSHAEMGTRLTGLMCNHRVWVFCCLAHLPHTSDFSHCLVLHVGAGSKGFPRVQPHPPLPAGPALPVPRRRPLALSNGLPLSVCGARFVVGMVGISLPRGQCQPWAGLLAGVGGGASLVLLLPVAALFSSLLRIQ